MRRISSWSNQPTGLGGDSSLDAAPVGRFGRPPAYKQWDT